MLAAIRVRLRALVCNQVPALIGICALVLFVEGLLVRDISGGLGEVGRFSPGAAAAAISGQDPGTLRAPSIGLVLLSFYATVTEVAGALVLAPSRRLDKCRSPRHAGHGWTKLIGT